MTEPLNLNVTTVKAPAPAGKSTDDYINEMSKLTGSELEAIVRSYQGRPYDSLTDDDLKKGLAALRLHRRTTAGPPKAKGKSAQIDIATLL